MTTKNTYRHLNMRIQWGSYDQWKAEGLTPPPCAYSPDNNPNEDIWGKASSVMGEIYFLIRPFASRNGFMLGFRLASSLKDDKVGIIAIRIDTQEHAEMKAEVHLTHLEHSYLTSKAEVAGIPSVQPGGEKWVKEKVVGEKPGGESAADNGGKPPDDDDPSYFFNPNAPVQKVADGLTAWLCGLNQPLPNNKINVCPLTDGTIGLWWWEGDSFDMQRVLSPGQTISLVKDGNLVCWTKKGTTQPGQVAAILPKQVETKSEGGEPPGEDARLGKSFHYGLNVGWDAAIKSVEGILKHSNRHWNVSKGAPHGVIRVIELNDKGVVVRPVAMFITRGALVELHKDGHLTQTYPDAVHPPYITIGYDLNPAEAIATIELFLESNLPARVARCRAHQAISLGLNFVAIVVMFYDEEGKVCRNPWVVIPGDTLLFCPKMKDLDFQKGDDKVELRDSRRECLVKKGVGK